MNTVFRIVLKAALAAALFLSAAAVRAADPWTQEQTGKAIGAAVLTLVDWGQTRYIAEHPDEFHEKLNWVLDDHPEKKEVDYYFAGVFVLGGLALHHAPAKLRNLLLNGTIALEVMMVGRNESIGIKVEF